MTSAVQLERAQAFISALSDLDADAMAAFLSPDFSHRIFPLSLGGLGKVVRDKAGFIEFAAGVKELVPRLNVGLLHFPAVTADFHFSCRPR